MLIGSTQWRRLAITPGQQTYRAIKAKLILLLTNDANTKNVTQFNKDFVFNHILIYIILYWDKKDFFSWKGQFCYKMALYKK